MKTKIKYLLVLVLASFVFVGCCTTHGKTNSVEYKFVTKSGKNIQEGEAQLNEIGKDGWKLVNANSDSTYWIFERPKH